MYQWLLFGHLLGVAVLMAGLGVHVVSVERLRQARTVSELQILLVEAKHGERMVLIGAVLLVAAGVTMAAGFWSFSDGWIATSIGLVITQGIAGSAVDRAIRRLRDAVRVAPDGTPSPHLTVLAHDPVLHASNRISVVLITEILFLMSVKPAVAGILWSLVAAVALVSMATLPLWARRSEPELPRRKLST